MSRPLLHVVSFTALVVILIAIADADVAPRVFHIVHLVPYGDKVAHAILFGTLAFLVERFAASRGWRVGPATVMLAVLVAAEETSQIWLPARAFTISDLVADFLGMAVGALVCWRLSRNRRVVTSQRPEED